MINRLDRRTFLASTVLAGACGGSWVSARAADSAPLSPEQMASLRQALKEAESHYDPAVKMLSSKVSSVGYHTTLKEGTVHGTRDSFTYAAALLDSSEEEAARRAIDILETVIALQDQNPENKTYGIWSWYLEEPLDTMSPPDWNWADFCGVQLLAVWINHRDRLPEDLRSKVRDSILHAAASIRKRNVGLGYTNIAIMGTYVTLTAGERMEQPQLLEYARDRLRRFHRYTFDQGTFTEYNSPTYSIVALSELTRMAMHFQNEDDRSLVEELLDLGWKHVARHFHAPTRQWAGPHSRCYSTDLRRNEKALAFLEAGCGYGGILTQERPLSLGLDAYRLDIRCPQAYRHYFEKLESPRFEVETFQPGKPQGEDTAVLGFQPQSDVIGSTMLHPAYTLGTANIGDFWNQRRSLLAYWGTAEKPVILQARFLHDGYDYCSALLFSQQRQGRALAAVVFVTDYGDTHPSLDKVKNATIRAKDLRLRFELSGAVDDVQIWAHDPSAPHFTIQGSNAQIVLHPLAGQFSDTPFRWVSGNDNEKKWIDAVAWAEDEKEFDFSQMASAFLFFGLEIVPAGQAAAPRSALRFHHEQDTVKAEWDGEEKMGLQLTVRPGPSAQVRNSFRVI